MKNVHIINSLGQRLIWGFFLCGALFSAQAELTLRCDYSNPENQREPMRYHWTVSNRISPMHGFNMPVGENPYICVVRPLGGKSKNGEKLIEEDTYKWDGENYVYDWVPLKTQIDTVQSSARIFQLMIDNVPWAFQRGLDLGGENEVETYGNAWPPNDSEAWAAYIQEMLRELVKTYGQEQVLQWRFCIGREIGTSGHWRGSMQEFFEHYATTVNAIHAILPEARVGTHFLWASANNSFGPDFVKWCKQNNVHYDFVGVSYYPFYNKETRVDLDYVYSADFAPIKDIPEWNPNAELEIHEFSLIKSMSKRGNSFDNAPKAHTEAFTVMLGKMMYEHGMHHIFRWGAGENKLAEQAFLAMKGNHYYTSSREGGRGSSGNMVDAVFARNTVFDQYTILLYNYNVDPNSNQTEPVRIQTILPIPPSTELTYRHAVYEKGALEWSKWKTRRTKVMSGREGSSFEMETKLPSFSFGKIEIRRRNTVGMIRVLTDRATGKKTEVKLLDLKRGKLICSARGRRFYIPVSSLSDEDVEFLKQWVQEK